MHERMFHANEAHRLDDPERLTWLPPADVLAALELAPGMRVADVGAGTGYFALPLARAVGPAGVVTAVDVQPAMLERLAEKLRGEGAPSNVERLVGEATATNLARASCDLAFYANVWHEIDDEAAALAECTRILAPGGRVAILDWRPDVERPPGPPIEHRIAAARVAESLSRAGFRVRKDEHVGRYGYLLVADRA